jgi:hypothetical protein
MSSQPSSAENVLIPTMRDMEQELYVLQKKLHDEEEWTREGGPYIRGRTAAFSLYKKLREEQRDYAWRVLTKNEAELYAQGIKHGVNKVRRQVEATSSRAHRGGARPAA